MVSEKIKESVSSPRFTFEQKAFIILQVVVINCSCFLLRVCHGIFHNINQLHLLTFEVNKT